MRILHKLLRCCKEHTSSLFPVGWVESRASDFLKLGEKAKETRFPVKRSGLISTAGDCRATDEEAERTERDTEN